MPTDTLIAYFEEGYHVTATATAPVVGKTLVAISGNLASDSSGNTTFSCATCGADAKAFGVAEYDAAEGAWFGVVRRGIVPITCGAAGDIAANTEVMSDASGNVIAWDAVVGHRPVGLCLNAATPGNDAMIALYQ